MKEFNNLLGGAAKRDPPKQVKKESASLKTHRPPEQPTPDEEEWAEELRYFEELEETQKIPKAQKGHTVGMAAKTQKEPSRPPFSRTSKTPS